MSINDAQANNIVTSLRDIVARCTTTITYIESLQSKAKPEPEPEPTKPKPSDERTGSNPYAGGPGSGSGNPYTDDPAIEPVRQIDPGVAEKVISIPPSLNTGDPVLRGMKVLAKASQQQGKPYGWGGTGPDRWDCSGLTQWAYKEALGIEIGRTTYDQIKGGETVLFSESRAGDLIFSNFENGDLTKPGHVSINMDGPDNVFEAGDPVGVYLWGGRGKVIVKRYV